MRGRAFAAALTVVASLVAGCDDDGWEPAAPFAPSLRPAFGARATDGALRIWTGSRCENVTRMNFTFDPGGTKLDMTSAGESGVEVDHLTIGKPYPGLEIAKPLPAGFDWRTAKSLMLWLSAEPATWGSSTDIATVVDGSDEHPEDTYWFQDVGWLNPEQVAAQDGKTFLATCTPDPAK